MGSFVEVAVTLSFLLSFCEFVVPLDVVVLELFGQIRVALLL